MLLQLVAPPARKQIRMLAARKSWYSSRRPYVLTTSQTKWAFRMQQKMSNHPCFSFQKMGYKTYAFLPMSYETTLLWFQIRLQLQQFTSRPAGGGHGPFCQSTPIQQRPRRRVLDLSSSATALVRLWRGLCFQNLSLQTSLFIYHIKFFGSYIEH